MSSTVVYLIFSVLWLSTPRSVIITDGQAQMVGIKVRERGNDEQCHSMEEEEGAKNKINRITFSVGIDVTMIDCGQPGWRRVAFINMTDTSYNCPTGLNLTPYSKRTCGRPRTIWGCSSTTFSVGGEPYSRVCGRIRGYQVGVTNVFSNRLSIDSYYVDGISLTHGVAGGRQHIWTFAVGASEVTDMYSDFGCPCDNASTSVVPAFVGNDYFCESGIHSALRSSYDYFGEFFPDDVLWDGQNCISNSTCCQFNNPPWFTKNLPNATTDDIELRTCTTSIPGADDVPIELIELYVQ